MPSSESFGTVDAVDFRAWTDPRVKALLAALSAGLLVAPSCGVASPGMEALVARLDAIRAEYDVPAFAIVLVDRRGILLADTRGSADLASGRRADGQTRFRIGSITKTFTAMAVLRARRSGGLELYDPVTKWLPEPPYRNPYAPGSPLRLEQLLEHTAGLQDWLPDEWDLNDQLSLNAALAYRPESRVVRWPPGWHMSYTNSGAGVVARVLEVATRVPFEEYMDTHVFEPLGMRTATLIPDEETFSRLATGYDSDARTPIPYWHVIFRASAAVSTHPSDMAGAIRMFLNRGRVANDEFLAGADIDRMESMQTTLAAHAGLTYGYGLGLRQWQRDGHSFFGHGGDADGHLAHFGYCTEAEMGYFVVINAFRHRPLRRMRDAIETWIVARLPEPAPRAEIEPVADELARLEGLYVTAVRRFPGDDGDDSVRVETRDGRLYTIQDGHRRRLVPVADGLYRRPDQSKAAFAIVEGPDGRLYLQGPIGSYVRVEGPATDPDP